MNKLTVVARYLQDVVNEAGRDAFTYPLRRRDVEDMLGIVQGAAGGETWPRSEVLSLVRKFGKSGWRARVRVRRAVRGMGGGMRRGRDRCRLRTRMMGVRAGG